MEERNTAAREAVVVQAKTAELVTRKRLRVLVASSSGGVGKSTIAESLLLPGLGCKCIYSVEAENGAGSKYAVPVKEFFASEVLDLWRDIGVDPDSVITDLGASDFSNFVGELHEANLLANFDYCVLVANANERAELSAVSTFETFRNFGFAPEKFRLVLNRVTMPGRIREAAVVAQFPHLTQYSELHPEFCFDPACFVPEMEKAFAALREENLSLREAIADETDYVSLNSKCLDNNDAEGAERAIRLAIVTQLARNAQSHFDRAFKALDLGHGNTGNDAS